MGGANDSKSNRPKPLSVPVFARQKIAPILCQFHAKNTAQITLFCELNTHHQAALSGQVNECHNRVNFTTVPANKSDGFDHDKCQTPLALLDSLRAPLGLVANRIATMVLCSNHTVMSKYQAAAGQTA